MMVAVVKRTYYINEGLDTALKLKAIKDRVAYKLSIIIWANYLYI